MRRPALHLALSLALIAAAAPAGAAARTATGRIVNLSSSSVTIRTGGRPMGVIAALAATADSITHSAPPYVWGGGHESAGVPSRGIRGGPGANGRRVGFDCSGSVAAVLAGGGLWTPGSGVPGDAGVIGELLARRMIAPGAGHGPYDVTLYAHLGHHIFMSIDGRFFGTSDGGGGGNPRGGAGWLDDGAPDARNPRFRQYHFLPGVLHDRTTYGHLLTFQAVGDTLSGYAVGDAVDAGYADAGAGIMRVRSLAFHGAVTTTGVISALAPDGSTLSVLAAGGHTLSFDASRLIGGTGTLALGDTVRVQYTRSDAGQPIARLVTVTAAPVTPGPVAAPAG